MRNQSPDHTQETPDLETATQSSDKKKKKKKEEPPFFSFENMRSLGFLVLVIFALRWSVASPYYVPTASMEPTIKVGDRLLANKLAYNLKVPFTDYVVAAWSKPQRGDIIVFRYPEDPSIDYVKRVVGVAGDKLRLVDDVLYVNDVPQERLDSNKDRSVLDDIMDQKELKLLYHEKLGNVDHWTMNFIPSARYFSQGNWPAEGYITVPEDSVYVIGDNRDNSADSRKWGKVPLINIHGKALFVLWSAYTPHGDSWWKVRFDRFGHWLDGDLPKGDAPLTSSVTN